MFHSFYHRVNKIILPKSEARAGNQTDYIATIAQKTVRLSRAVKMSRDRACPIIFVHFLNLFVIWWGRIACLHFPCIHGFGCDTNLKFSCSFSWDGISFWTFGGPKKGLCINVKKESQRRRQRSSFTILSKLANTLRTSPSSCWMPSRCSNCVSTSINFHVSSKERVVSCIRWNRKTPSFSRIVSSRNSNSGMSLQLASSLPFCTKRKYLSLKKLSAPSCLIWVRDILHQLRTDADWDEARKCWHFYTCCIFPAPAWRVGCPIAAMCSQALYQFAFWYPQEPKSRISVQYIYIHKWPNWISFWSLIQIKTFILGYVQWLDCRKNRYNCASTTWKVLWGAVGLGGRHLPFWKEEMW